ncbi:MAG: hypothetical protein K6L81_05400 [Agarilytica sp.]
MMLNYTNELLELLKILASSAQVQLTYLEGLGNPSVDELALEFDDLFLLASSKVETGVLTSPQFDLLERLNSKLDEISGVDMCWTTTAISDSKEWEEIRVLANLCLKKISP